MTPTRRRPARGHARVVALATQLLRSAAACLSPRPASLSEESYFRRLDLPGVVITESNGHLQVSVSGQRDRGARWRL